MGQGRFSGWGSCLGQVGGGSCPGGSAVAQGGLRGAHIPGGHTSPRTLRDWRYCSCSEHSRTGQHGSLLALMRAMPTR